MAEKILTAKQEAFGRLLFEGVAQDKAYLQAGYSAKNSPATIVRRANELAHNGQIQAMVASLRAEVRAASIASVEECQQVLTEIIRGRLADFMINPTAEKLRSAALLEMTIRDGPRGKTTTVKLNDPTKAIDLLSKMRGLYTDGPTVNVDNRQVVIKVVYGSQDGGPLEIEGSPAKPQGAS